MRVYELIDLLNLEDPDATVRVVNDNNGQTVGYIVDVDNDGDVLIFVDPDPAIDFGEDYA